MEKSIGNSNASQFLQKRQKSLYKPPAFPSKKYIYKPNRCTKEKEAEAILALLLLIPANVLISAYLSKRGLKIAAIFHAVLFGELLLTAFILNGGSVRDYVAAHSSLGGLFALIANLLGSGAPAFIAPFCALETVCYIIVALAFVALTEEVVDEVARFFKKRVMQIFICISGSFRALRSVARPTKIFRKNCVMRC